MRIYFAKLRNFFAYSIFFFVKIVYFQYNGWRVLYTEISEMCKSVQNAQVFLKSFLEWFIMVIKTGKSLKKLRIFLGIFW